MYIKTDSPCEKTRCYGKYLTGIYRIPENHFYVTDLRHNNDDRNRNRCVVLNYGQLRAAHWKQSNVYLDFNESPNPLDLDGLLKDQQAIIGLKDSQFTCVFDTLATPEKPFNYTTFIMPPGEIRQLNPLSEKIEGCFVLNGEIVTDGKTLVNGQAFTAFDQYSSRFVSQDIVIEIEAKKPTTILLAHF